MVEVVFLKVSSSKYVFLLNKKKLVGGGWYLLGIQSLTALCISVWGICSSLVLLWFINKIVPIRMDVHEELLGADITEHLVRHTQVKTV